MAVLDFGHDSSVRSPRSHLGMGVAFVDHWRRNAVSVVTVGRVAMNTFRGFRGGRELIAGGLEIFDGTGYPWTGHGLGSTSIRIPTDTAQRGEVIARSQAISNTRAVDAQKSVTFCVRVASA